MVRLAINASQGVLARLDAEAAQSAALVAQLALLDASDFAEALAQARAAMRRDNGLKLGGQTPARIRALALLELACRKTLGMLPSREQVVAALGMHDAFLAEMGPGQGKTLAVALAAILYAWSGRSCHVVTAADYLALRDASLMQPLFALCGCTAMALTHDMQPEQLAAAYEAEIVYGTGRQFLADYMRDQMQRDGASDTLRRRLWEMRTPAHARKTVTRGTCIALIDDVDHVLIDEATTPLVISASGSYSVLEEASRTALHLVDGFVSGRDYRLDAEPPHVLAFTPEGERQLEELAAQLPPFWRHPKRREDILSLAILTRDLFKRDRHYVVHEGRVIIVDENIHRMLSGRAWHFGAAQAIEAREGLALTVPPRTVARTALQDYFPRYERLAGTGSLLDTLDAELSATYRLQVLRLTGTDMPAAQRKVVQRHEFLDRSAKLAAFVDTIEALNQAHRPVLIGTLRMLDTAEVAMHLAKRNLQFLIIEGRDPIADAQSLGQAGQPGSITLVTGATGKGIDIPVSDAVSADGGLQVLMFEHQDSARMDSLFSGRTARRGKQGRVEVFASLEDDLIVRAAPVWMRALASQLSQRSPALRRHCIGLLIAYAQSRSSKLAVRHRKLIMMREAQLDQQLAFSRKS